MKKSICMTLLVVFIMMTSAVYAAEGDIKVLLNDREVVYDVQPYLDTQAQTVLVPLRKTFETFGLSVTWDEQTKTAFAFGKGTAIILKQDSKEATVMDKKKELICPPAIIEGRLLIPLRFVAESIGANVSWDQATKTVRIDTTKNSQGQVVDKIELPPLEFKQ